MNTNLDNNEDFYKEIKEALEESRNCEWFGEEIFDNLRRNLYG